ncbi:TIM barrel protein [Acetonema longum]|uniref:Xylose isomerase domain-containing protein n=1 Tax=Acetonema longum DSM 6540 TaxID=1009370 RepID=F7NQ49_9FIRM|nr:TIM barrel protein [Acetonema longum]EGO61808.1 xylose isomerase domain-containing protein [Acetonema longum DSM 6540]
MKELGETMELAKFGPAGNPDAFYEAGFKASVDIPGWLSRLRLAAYEYQCGRGVNVGEKTAGAIGKAAAEQNIALSIHAPYYINLATEDESLAANTENHILKSLQAARWMGADRVIFHMGSPGKSSRQAAMDRAKHRLSGVLDKIERLGLSDIILAPETMGKVNQLGSLEEVVQLCKLAPNLLPAVDFGHLHAVTRGKYTDRQEFEAVFDYVQAELGEAAACSLHIHFSRIEYTKAGEKRHWTFADEYGPPHEPFIAVIADRKLQPRIICESAGTQARDALIMQELYLRLLNKDSVAG